MAHRPTLKRTQHVIPQLGIVLVLLDEVGLLHWECVGLQFALLGHLCVVGQAWGEGGEQNKACESSSVSEQTRRQGWTSTHLWSSAWTWWSWRMLVPAPRPWLGASYSSPC